MVTGLVTEESIPPGTISILMWNKSFVYYGHEFSAKLLAVSGNRPQNCLFSAKIKIIAA